MLTIRVDCERINGRYTNAEYRGKLTRRDLTLNTVPYAGGGGGGAVVRSPPGPPGPHRQLGKLFQNNADFHQKLSLHP